MALPHKKIDYRYSSEEYLEMERAAEVRHEYLDGEIYEMAGESLDHGRICTNIVTELHTQLRGKDCDVLSKDTKVRSSFLPTPRRMMKGLFSYPDVLVVCGTPQFHDEYQDILLNPVVIIEVSSDSTEVFGRVKKFFRYQLLESLIEYVLVSQRYYLIERYARREDGWLYSSVGGLSASLHLASIDCDLRLSDVYDRVTIPEGDPLAEPSLDEREEQ